VTPFGIRKRLKSLLGGKPAAAPAAKKKFKLVIHNGKGRTETYEGEVGQSVLLAAGNVSAPIASGCSDSSCATCRISVLSGGQHLSPQNATESQTLKANNREPELRLACQAVIQGEGTVEVQGFEFLE
jgi:ferredoxin